MEWMKQLISNRAWPAAGVLGKEDCYSEGYGIGIRKVKWLYICG